jgi:hypothetical protein
MVWFAFSPFVVGLAVVLGSALYALYLSWSVVRQEDTDVRTEAEDDGLGARGEQPRDSAGRGVTAAASPTRAQRTVAELAREADRGNSDRDAHASAAHSSAVSTRENARAARACASYSKPECAPRESRRGGDRQPP